MEYEVFGLRVRSELPLDELFEAAPDSGDADVDVRIGSIPRDDGEDGKSGYSLVGTAALLAVRDVGRYWIDGGREIVVEPAPGTSERNLRLFLLGSAFGALLHQRGLLPLHANAIEFEGRAVAFMGHSGAGKSTMAAWFLDRGHRVLADDVCVVTFDGEGRPIAHGGIPRLRLWREAIEASGRTAADYEHAFDAMDKYNVPTPRRSDREPLPLSHIYLLRRAPDGAAAPAIERLLGVEAVDGLVANTYRGGFLKKTGGTGRHLSQCLSVVARAPVFRAERLWGYDAFEEQAAMIEDHVRAVIAGRG
jgi:hypothetical protein